MKLWAVESVLAYRDEHDGDFPTFEDLVEIVADVVPCSFDDAEGNVWEALRREEIEAVFDDHVDMRLRLGRNALSGAPWLRNHPWRKEYS